MFCNSSACSLTYLLVFVSCFSSDAMYLFCFTSSCLRFDTSCLFLSMLLLSSRTSVLETCLQQLFDCALDFNKYLVNIS